MRRHLVSAVVAGLFGLLLMASDASACHCKKKACPAPAPCAAPCPPPCPEPCPPPPCKPKKHHKLFSCFKHKKTCAPVACAPAPCAPCGTPVAMASGQVPSGQTP